jgi:hypothetical protein
MKITAVALLLLAGLLGCSKVNRENYDKIKAGMEYKQVISIIGEPDKCDAALGIKTCVWGNETKNITISFIANDVFVTSMKGL